MSKAKSFTLVICVLGVSALALLVGLNRETISDQFAALTYQPSSEVENIESSLQLTDHGKQIFRAAQPALEDQTAFNEHCQSHNVDVSVLGCYTSNHIYLYRVDNSELNGIMETTAAHELLHAAWARMSSDEQSQIGRGLEEYYNQHKDQFGKEMVLYNETQRLDELHSRIGTEGSNLPDSLSDHYAKYFTNQSRIVGFYNSYNGRFKQLQTEAEKLLAEIEQLKKTIETDSQTYQTRTATLSQKITEFNQCANTANCFSSQGAFNSRRSELIAEQEALEKLYQDINKNIETHNQKIAAYNANIFRTKNLQDSINSNNSQPPKI